MVTMENESMKCDFSYYSTKMKLIVCHCTNSNYSKVSLYQHYVMLTTEINGSDFLVFIKMHLL